MNEWSDDIEGVMENVRYTGTVFSTSNEAGRTAIGSADATVKGFEIEYNLLTNPEEFKISPLRINK
jgi:hypothetical protein